MQSSFTTKDYIGKARHLVANERLILPPYFDNNELTSPYLTHVNGLCAIDYSRAVLKIR